MSNFIHLHTHSDYSLLNGLSKINQLVKQAKKYGMTALALTDSGNLYGAIKFYQACKAEGLKPIIGLEAYIAPRSRHDKDPNLDQRSFDLTLLAKNYTGYKNLIKLVSVSHLEGFYGKPRIDKKILREYSQGLICLSGSLQSELGLALQTKKIDRAREIIKEHQEIFGPENYFLEFMSKPSIEDFENFKNNLKKLSEEFQTPIVATIDSHYLNKDDREAFDTLLKVENLAKISLAQQDDYSFVDFKTATLYFKDFPEALENTLKVAEMIEIDIPLGRWVFPNYELPPGDNYDTVLREKSYAGLKERNLEDTPEVIQRIDYELEIIKKKGFAPYFLVVADLLRFARENKILSNTRGSAAGSLVSYLLQITTVNPLQFDLPFERFLNPERPSPPDIDMDFADNRRDEIIEYTKKKYGSDKVAQIGTFGTMMARGAVRDVARALEYPYAVGDRLSKMIPLGQQGFPMTIEHALSIIPELKTAYETEPDTKKILDLARKLEGRARHISVHAAGMVISPEPLTTFTPLQFDPKGDKIITQYDMYSIEDVGLLKFDILGIRNLTILEDTIDRLKKIRDLEINITKIPMDDKKTFEMLSRGETLATFQLGSAGMTRFLKELKPETIHDINAMVALYRPGPMQFIPDYIKRKHNPRLIKYLDPALEKILKKTYGILVYQDDLLKIAREIAGYSWGEADKFRKAVGKKIPEEMEKQKERFIKGCVENSHWTWNKASEIWKWIEPFAAYGFNKGHAVSYGYVAYLTAYFKANYPAEYMSAVLTAESDDIETVAQTVLECKRMGFQVLPPDINESFSDFTIIQPLAQNKIRFGLQSIKNFGQEIGQAIIKERKERGPFRSISNFLERIKHKNLNKKSLEALIMSGAMDNLGERGKLILNIEELLEYNKNITRQNENQGSLFGALGSSVLPELRLKDATASTMDQKLNWEKELLGLYISGHPLDKWKNVLEKSKINIKKIKEVYRADMEVTLFAMIEEIKTIITKNNERMAFVRLSDLTGSIESVFFPKIFNQTKNILIENKCLIFTGRVSNRNNEKSLIIEKVKES